jgi:hypothetical protein
MNDSRPRRLDSISVTQRARRVRALCCTLCFTLLLGHLVFMIGGCGAGYTATNAANSSAQILSIVGPTAVLPGQTIQLVTSPIVTGQQVVTWSVESVAGMNVGTVSSDGAYSAPSGNASSMEVLITASAPTYTPAVEEITVTSPAPAGPAPTTYYLDSANGSDTNTGTDQNHPWSSVERLEQRTLNPGDSVLFRRGGVWHSTLTVSNSGNSSSPITYADYGTGALPLIDVATAVSGWNIEAESGFAAYYTVLQSQPHIVVADADILWQNIVPNGALNAPFQPASTLTPGSYTWDASQSRLYVRVSDDTNPSTHIITAGSTPFAVLVQGQSYIRIQNLELEGAEYDCIRVAGGATNIVLTGNTVRFCGSAGNQGGIFVDGATNATITNNIISYVGNIGINISGYAASANNNITISHNTISYAGYDCVQIGPTLDGSIQNVIVDHQDTSYCGQVRSDAAGIDAYLGGDGLIFRYNTAHDNGLSPRFAAGLRLDSGTTNAQLYGNLAYHNSSGCVQITGSGHSIFNNTCYENNVNPAYDYGEINIFDSVTGIPSALHVWNNVIWPSSGKHSWIINDAATLPLSTDHNLYMLAGAASPFTVGGIPYTFQAWQTYVRGEAGSLTTTKPMLSSPIEANFTPLAGSPAFKSGRATSAYSATILGLTVAPPPNIGAF